MTSDSSAAEWPTRERVETYNPWTVVNLVFHHLVEEGLHPVLGDAGDPSVPARQLLLALGVQPGQDHEGPGATLIQDELARIRAALAEDLPD